MHTYAQGLGIREIQADGNCLFRAIADQIEGNENQHAVYRGRICQFMLKHEERFKWYLDDDRFSPEKFKDYVNFMRKDATWGGNMELAAAMVLFETHIVVHQAGVAQFVMTNHELRAKMQEEKNAYKSNGSALERSVANVSDSPNVSVRCSRERCIHLSFHGECHYASVRRLDDVSKKKVATGETVTNEEMRKNKNKYKWKDKGKQKERADGKGKKGKDSKGDKEVNEREGNGGEAQRKNHGKEGGSNLARPETRNEKEDKAEEQTERKHDSKGKTNETEIGHGEASSTGGEKRGGGGKNDGNEPEGWCILRAEISELRKITHSSKQAKCDW